MIDLLIVGEEVHVGWNSYEFEDSPPQFNSYRLYSNATNGCEITEMQLIGHEALDTDAEEYNCPIEITQSDGNTTHLTETVNYRVSLTPVLTAVNPRWGSVEGGTPLTFTGTNLSPVPSAYSILLDGIECIVTAASTESVSCTTQARIGAFNSDPSIEVEIVGVGLTATVGVVFRYVSLWS